MLSTKIRTTAVALAALFALTALTATSVASAARRAPLRQQPPARPRPERQPRRQTRRGPGRRQACLRSDLRRDLRLPRRRQRQRHGGDVRSVERPPERRAGRNRRCRREQRPREIPGSKGLARRGHRQRPGRRLCGDLLPLELGCAPDPSHRAHPWPKESLAPAGLSALPRADRGPARVREGGPKMPTPGSEQPAERAARVVHEVEQRLRHDAEEDRRRRREQRDEQHLRLRRAWRGASAGSLVELRRAAGERRQARPARPAAARRGRRPAPRASTSPRSPAGSSRARSSSRSRSPRRATCSRPRRRRRSGRTCPMKPAVAGMPASASIAIVIGQASSGRSRPRPASACDRVAERRFALARDDHRERGHVHEQVDGEVEDRRLHAELRRDDDAGEHVAGLRDRRVGEHPLQRGLPERADVADDDRDRRERRERRRPSASARSISATSKKRRNTPNAATFVATAMNAVTGVGAPS